jgi:5-methylcytosine-specific restriction protein A
MPNKPPQHAPRWAQRERQARDRDRSPDRRGYDWTWKKFRLGYLSQHPLCADCAEAGRVTPATELHHVVRLAARPDLRLDASNVRALCAPCHTLRTNRGE